MRELTRLTAFVLTLCCTTTSVIAQRHRSPPPKKEVIEIEATTRDGKVVILKSDGTWRYATPAERASEPPAVTKKTTLSLETGIIYRNGEVVPVARTTFYLLDDDVLTIAKSGGIQPRPDTLSIYKDVDRSLLSDIAHALAGQYQSLYADFGANFLKVLEPHIIARFTTDFSGKATVADLEAKQ